MGSSILGGGTLLGAGELYHNDGPFDVPDDYRRLNGLLRYRHGGDGDFYALTVMAYSGEWNSTDQVPERAIDDGVINRFGSLNSTDGGISSRSSVSVSRVIRTDTDQLQFSAYVIRYRLDLWSTFTYFLRDPLKGDQMLQHDDRAVFGFKGSKTWNARIGEISLSNVIGAQARIDDIYDVGIFSTYQRRTIGTMQNAGVVESNGAFYAQSSVQWRDHWRTVVGLRADQFEFDVKDKMLNAGNCNINSDPLGCVTGTKRASIFSPKLGLVLGPWAKTTFFLNFGDGYHSNDARGVTRSGENPAASPVTPLARAASAEVGFVRVLPNWETSLDLFQLKLRSELVFDGDSGVTKPSGATTRSGIESATTYRINAWLTAQINATLSKARFDSNALTDDLGCGDAAPVHSCARPIGVVGRYIPNSPTRVVDAGLTARRESGWFGALRARHFGESPLVEDNRVRSPAYTTVDARIGFQRGKRWLVALDVFNVADVKWNDIEYYYVSRLQSEATPRADTVVHPGVPRTLRAQFQYRF